MIICQSSATKINFPLRYSYSKLTTKFGIFFDSAYHEGVERLLNMWQNIIY